MRNLRDRIVFEDEIKESMMVKFRSCFVLYGLYEAFFIQKDPECDFV